MNSIMGLIYLNEVEKNLSLLTRSRCLASTPFLGHYRLIDFMLSSMIFSGIQNVAIFTTKKYRALLNHLGSGKEWGLDKKRDGLFLFFPTLVSSQSKTKTRDVDMFHQNLDYLINSDQEYVVILPGNIVGCIDFKWTLAKHKESESDITLLYSQNYIQSWQSYNNNTTNNTTITPDETIMSNGYRTYNNSNNNYTFLNTFMMKRTLLIDLLINSQNYETLIELINKHINSLRITALVYPEPLISINKLEDYFNSSIALLDPKFRRQILDPAPLSKTKDLPPAQYGKGVQVKNSFVGDGCCIYGNVTNSILFHSVTVEEGANVRNSIIFPDSLIKKNSQVNKIIADKQVKIKPDTSVSGSQQSPFVIAKRSRV